MNTFATIFIFMTVLNSMMFVLLPAYHVTSLMTNTVTLSGSGMDAQVMSYGGNLTSAIPTGINTEQASSGGITLVKIFNDLGTIGKFIMFILNFIFMPVSILSSIQMPSVVILLVGVPLGLMYLISAVLAIRGISE